MTLIPPIPSASVGSTSGGGLLDSIKGAMGGVGGAAAPTSPDGSIGLFDGVGKRALIGGAIGAGVGFLPFIPGGPILGGIMGALGGVAMGVFSNWRTMNAIREENAATLAAMGVQVNDPVVQQALRDGNVEQLMQMTVQQGGGAAGQAPVQQSAAQGPVQQAVQSPVYAYGGGDLLAAAAAAPAAAVDPASQPATSGVAEIAPAQAGIAPAPSLAPSAPPAAIDAASNPSDAGIAPAQAPTADGPAATTVAAAAATATPEQLAQTLQVLQAQIDQLRSLLAAMEERAAERERLAAAA